MEGYGEIACGFINGLSAVIFKHSFDFDTVCAVFYGFIRLKYAAVGMAAVDIGGKALSFRLRVKLGEHGFGQRFACFPIVGIAAYFVIVCGPLCIGVVL